MSQLVFDENFLPKMEALYRTHDVLRRRRLVGEALGVGAGDRILDVGCGPGFYAAELLEQVGPEGSVVGVDRSPQMLAAAAQRCAGHANCAFHEGDASSLPVDSASFDAALAVQVLEYVSDPTAALAELHRALRPGGRVVVWDVDWATLSMHSSDPGRMSRVLDAWDEHLAHPSLPRTLGARLRSVGFDGVQSEGHTFATTELSPNTYGGSFVPLIEEYVAGLGGSEDEAAAWGEEQRELGRRGEFYFACIQFCFSATRPG